MERRRFTAEFKREAVKLAGQDGISRAKVALHYYVAFAQNCRRAKLRAGAK